MRRRDFGVLLGSALFGWPLVGRAQHDRTRRIAVLMGYVETDPEAQRRFAAFKEALATLGWKEGGNLKIDLRWAGGDVNRASAVAREVVALKPEVILSNTTSMTAAVQQATDTIPTVFVPVADAVASGFVKTLQRPGGNMTGFTVASLADKWLQLLKEIAPRLRQVAVLFNPKTAIYADSDLRPLKTAAPRLGVKTSTAPVESDSEIDLAVAELGRTRRGGLIVMNDVFNVVHRKTIIDAAARYKVPAMYSYVTPFVQEGGLISYGVDFYDVFRRAASYVDRILQGATPGDLPVQEPTKFELGVNMKTAKALGLKIPQSFLARADQVIE